MKAMKTLFIWLLLSFVPLQGIAANALLICKAANQHASSPHVTHVAETHAHPCDAVDRATMEQDQTHDSHQNADANCVAQYAGVPWMPAGEVMLPPAGFVSDRISYAGFHVPSFIPDGPERPPRSLSL